MIKRLEHGVFTIRDMHEQFSTILQMGPINKIMGSIPGFSEDMFKGTEAESQGRVKKFMTIMGKHERYR